MLHRASEGIQSDVHPATGTLCCRIDRVWSCASELTTKAQPRRNKDVARVSGTDNAHRRWLPAPASRSSSMTTISIALTPPCVTNLLAPDSQKLRTTSRGTTVSRHHL